MRDPLLRLQFLASTFFIVVMFALVTFNIMLNAEFLVDEERMLRMEEVSYAVPHEGLTRRALDNVRTLRGPYLPSY